MIFIKSGRSYTFRERAPEWILAFGLLVWGIMLALHPHLFDSGFYRPMLAIMSQYDWTLYTCFLGIFRIMVLAINGAWRATPHLRAIGAVGGVSIWSSLFVISLLNLQARATGIGTFAMLVAFDLLALWWAAGDAKVADVAAKRTKVNNGR